MIPDSHSSRMARIEHGTPAHIAALAACVAAVLIRRWLRHMYEEHAHAGWECEGDGDQAVMTAAVEEMEKASAADIDPEKQSPAWGNLKTPLLLWALFTLPMNVAAWAVPNIFWTHDSPSLTVSLRISLVLMGLSPVLASLRALIASLKRTTSTHTIADLSPSMLDGAVTAPLSMLWLWYVFPERFGCNVALQLVCWAFVLLQAAGWMYFVRRSESSMAPLGAPVSNV